MIADSTALKQNIWTSLSCYPQELPLTDLNFVFSSIANSSSFCEALSVLNVTGFKLLI